MNPTGRIQHLPKIEKELNLLGQGQKISVSKVRKQLFEKKVNGKTYNFYSVYYQVGNGRFNIDKSIEDIKWIMKDLSIQNREILENESKKTTV